MWWKLGIGSFFLAVALAGGDLAQIFIGFPLGCVIMISTAVLHQKIFKTDPMKSSSFMENVALGLMLLLALVLSFWLIDALT